MHGARRPESSALAIAILCRAVESKVFAAKPLLLEAWGKQNLRLSGQGTAGKLKLRPGRKSLRRTNFTAV